MPRSLTRMRFPVGLLGSRETGLSEGDQRKMSRITSTPGARRWLATGLLTTGVAAAGLLALAAPAASAATAGAVVPARSAGPAAAAGAATANAGAPAWRTVKSVSSGHGDFTAVVATGTAGGWAFGGDFNPAAAATAWRLSGGTWTRDSAFPGKPGETVVAAGASSASDVWAFTQAGTGSRVLHYNGRAWSVVKTFTAQVGGASVVSKDDVWVFGTGAFGSPALGAWHYNGHAWQFTGVGLEGGSALCPVSVWAFRGTEVYHFNGSRWAATQLKSLLPAKMLLNDPAVTGIIALSAGNVYAIGNGNLEDEGGPLVVLHYDGHRWTRVAAGNYGYGTDGSFGGAQQVSADGVGGLWLPMPGFDGQKSYIVHYAAGRLTPAALPGNPLGMAVVSISRVPGTRDQLAGGGTFKTLMPGVAQSAVILRYS
jgi:hypothetical protein